MAQPHGFPIGIGELSKQTGCKIETIRYYEQKSLLPKPPRTDGGHRLYSEEMRGRLLFIRRSRELGFSMDEIRGLLSLVDGEQVSCERVKSMAEEHLRDIRAKISDLRRMQRTLSDLASRCSGEDVPDCPIIETLQRGRSTKIAIPVTRFDMPQSDRTGKRR
jgi:MerR family mercuric resistance operon transcriptional regulator